MNSMKQNKQENKIKQDIWMKIYQTEMWQKQIDAQLFCGYTVEEAIENIKTELSKKDILCREFFVIPELQVLMKLLDLIPTVNLTTSNYDEDDFM
jgi:hypothetical protein